MKEPSIETVLTMQLTKSMSNEAIKNHRTETTMKTILRQNLIAAAKQ